MPGITRPFVEDKPLSEVDMENLELELTDFLVQGWCSLQKSVVDKLRRTDARMIDSYKGGVESYVFEKHDLVWLKNRRFTKNLPKS